MRNCYYNSLSDHAWSLQIMLAAIVQPRLARNVVNSANQDDFVEIPNCYTASNAARRVLVGGHSSGHNLWQT